MSMGWMDGYVEVGDGEVINDGDGVSVYVAYFALPFTSPGSQTIIDTVEQGDVALRNVTCATDWLNNPTIVGTVDGGPYTAGELRQAIFAALNSALSTVWSVQVGSIRVWRQQAAQQSSGGLLGSVQDLITGASGNAGGFTSSISLAAIAVIAIVGYLLLKETKGLVKS